LATLKVKKRTKRDYAQEFFKRFQKHFPNQLMETHAKEQYLSGLDWIEKTAIAHFRLSISNIYEAGFKETQRTQIVRDYLLCHYYALNSVRICLECAGTSQKTPEKVGEQIKELEVQLQQIRARLIKQNQQFRAVASDISEYIVLFCDVIDNCSRFSEQLNEEMFAKICVTVQKTANAGTLALEVLIRGVQQQDSRYHVLHSVHEELQKASHLLQQQLNKNTTTPTATTTTTTSTKKTWQQANASAPTPSRKW